MERVRPSRESSVRPLVYTVAVFGLLMLAWEQLSAHFSSQEKGLLVSGSVYVDESQNENLKKVLADLPARRSPRVLLLGCSQVATVKEGPRSQSVSFKLGEALGQRLGPCEVVDLSAGGQVMMESLAVLVGSADTVKADLVVLGLGVFSVQGTALRESLLEAFAPAVLADTIAANLLKEQQGPFADWIAALRSRNARQARSGDERIVNRAERIMGETLQKRLRMVANRESMFNQLLDTPVRRDLAAYLGRRTGSVRVARTYSLGPGYELSLAGLVAMSEFCKTRNTDLVLVMLPFDASRKPVPYLPETQARFLRDLQAVARDDGSTVLDLSGSLTPAEFGSFTDGSPDGLHFTARGHEIVAQRTAVALEPLLRRRVAVSSASRPAH